MKKLFILFVFSLFVVSCSTVNNYKYNVSMIKPIVSDSLRYKDDKIDVKFDAVTDNIKITLQNKSDKTLKINWDELSIVLFNIAGRVIHEGIPLIDRDKAQVPTIIPVNSIWIDKIVPVNNIYYVKAMKVGSIYTEGHYGLNPLFVQEKISAKSKKTDKTNNDWVNSLKGSTFFLHFPIYYGDEKIEYDYVFKINDIETTKSKFSPYGNIQKSKSKNRK